MALLSYPPTYRITPNYRIFISPGNEPVNQHQCSWLRLGLRLEKFSLWGFDAIIILLLIMLADTLASVNLDWRQFY